MNWSSGLSWFKPIQGWRLSRDVVEADHADMGTAFGLDASMGPADDSHLPAALSAAPGAMPWEHRLTRRTSL